MEMTMDIDESTKELSKWRKDLNYDRGDYCYGGTTTKHSLDVAIDTMRKYQKIKQIVRNYDVTWEFHHMKSTIDEIRKVVEDEEGG